MLFRSPPSSGGGSSDEQTALALIEKMPVAECMTELSKLINDIEDLKRAGTLTEANYETAHAAFNSRKAQLTQKKK